MSMPSRRDPGRTAGGARTPGGARVDLLLVAEMVERGAKRLNALHARSRKVEFVAERLDVRRDLNVFVQPFQRYFHDILFL